MQQGYESGRYIKEHIAIYKEAVRRYLGECVVVVCISRGEYVDTSFYLRWDWRGDTVFVMPRPLVKILDLVIYVGQLVCHTPVRNVTIVLCHRPDLSFSSFCWSNRGNRNGQLDNSVWSLSRGGHQGRQIHYPSHQLHLTRFSRHRNISVCVHENIDRLGIVLFLPLT